MKDSTDSDCLDWFETHPRRLMCTAFNSHHPDRYSFKFELGKEGIYPMSPYEWSEAFPTIRDCLKAAIKHDEKLARDKQ